jgi:hypothetical protein
MGREKRERRGKRRGKREEGREKREERREKREVRRTRGITSKNVKETGSPRVPLRSMNGLREQKRAKS